MGANVVPVPWLNTYSAERRRHDRDHRSTKRRPWAQAFTQSPIAQAWTRGWRLPLQPMGSTPLAASYANPIGLVASTADDFAS